jgi:apolipoprotein N-acyltransferase
LKKTQLDSLYFTLSYFAASALILTIIQPPFHFSFLAWIAYVPLIIAAIRSENKICLYFGSWIVAFLYWLGNIYWMAYVTISGWIAFCAYIALLWPALVLAIRVVRRYKVPFIISTPVLIVGIEQLQGFLLGGFYWRHLSHSQYANITLIQIADICGAAGLSFLVALVNALIVELILARKSRKLLSVVSFVKVLVAFCAVAGTLLYGGYRINESADVFEKGPVIAAVQSNLPQSVKDSELFDVNREVFEGLLALSKTAAADGAELVIWPETIIPAIMDKPVWPYLLDANESLFYNKALGEFARSEDVYMLVGAPGGEVIHKQDGNLALDKYNSAFLYEPNGDQAPLKYSKIHLVPFGEVVPFKYSVPWLYNLLMKFSPYDFDYNLTPGTQFAVFNMLSNAKEKQYEFGVMICYESTIPEIARGFTLNENGEKKVEWLVNISNDGWFVKFSNGKVRPSTELQQHTIASVFRAVENRLSVIRSVNTGISCLIDPLGRIQNSYLVGDLPVRAFGRAGVEGYFVDRVVIDGRVTVFSRYGQWLGTGCRIIVLGILILLPSAWIVRNIRKRFRHK